MAKLDAKDSIFSRVWLAEQFDQIDKANALILKRIEELSKQSAKETAVILDKLNVSDTQIIPTLEAAIRLVSARATVIDKKVKDVPTPNK